jgi:hypothetical protein
VRLERNRGNSMTELYIDREWVQLIEEAIGLGISREEVRIFLQSIIEGKNTTEVSETINLK